jgi:hypothetical protein
MQSITGNKIFVFMARGFNVYATNLPPPESVVKMIYTTHFSGYEISGHSGSISV